MCVCVADDGSGGGGIAGIVVSVLVGVGVIVGVVFAWRHKESIKSKLQSKTQSGGKDIDTTSLGGNSMATTSSTTQILPATGISFDHGTNAAMYFSNPESDA
jgi:phosphate/sulfate permease